nr:cytochrome c maturation protein CcmE [Actinomycetota bacterium]
VVYRGLGDATLYFRNADEAVADRDELGTRDFRLQGLVVEDAVQGDGVTEFTVAFNDVEVPVRSTAGPPSLFELGIPVVLEGHFAEGEDIVFLAHRILVKHDETYDAENPDRVVDAVDGQTEP